MNLNMLIVAPHADDEVLGCGGLIAKRAKAGWRVHVVIAAAGGITPRGADLLPIGNLLKTQVRELAVYLGVPREITEKPPSPGLWAGQTAEGELGISYAEVDRYLLGVDVIGKVRERVESLKAGSEHKRVLAPVPPF